MRRLTQAPNIALATLWADGLNGAGISASVQRRFLIAIAGEMPPDQCLPEIWISDDSQLAAARVLLHALQNPPQHRWLCGCGEFVEGGFEFCWHCNAPMPETGASPA